MSMQSAEYWYSPPISLWLAVLIMSRAYSVRICHCRNSTTCSARLSKGSGSIAAIIDRSGYLVAVSREVPLIGGSGESQYRIHAIDCADKVIATAATYHPVDATSASSGDDPGMASRSWYHEFLIDREDYFVSSSPFTDDRSLDWTVLIYVPLSTALRSLSESLLLSALISLTALAVVAEEIRNLSESSTSSAADIIKQIQAMREKNSEGVRSIEELTGSFKALGERILAAGGKLSTQALKTGALLADVKDVLNLNSNLDDDTRRNFAAVDDLEAMIGVYKLG
ncbi:MAG: hypothetical protein ABIJ86_08510 [Spirochaetota bacterium]